MIKLNGWIGKSIKVEIENVKIKKESFEIKFNIGGVGKEKMIFKLNEEKEFNIVEIMKKKVSEYLNDWKKRLGVELEFSYELNEYLMKIIELNYI